MCLAIPARIESADGTQAVVSVGGACIVADLSMTPEAHVGDWVLIHAGYAIARLDEQQALETYELLKQAGELTAERDGFGASSQGVPE